jgi:NADH-quinone oxidoreductase subunit J
VSWLEVICYALLGALALAGALNMLLQRDPIRSALGLLLAMLCLGVLYLLLAAPFVGFVQLIVYAGAIVVLFLLAMMNFPIAPLGPNRLQGSILWASGALTVLGIYLMTLVVRLPKVPGLGAPPPGFGTPEAIGRVLVGDGTEIGKFVYLFQLAAVLLLIALVAAIYLTREDEPAEDFERDPDEVAA